MKVDDIISEIIKIVKDDNAVFDGNIYTFKYRGNIKSENDYNKLYSNPQITVVGQENIKRYNQLFQDLAKELKVDKKLSLKSFMDKTQDLLFEGKFNAQEITRICDSLEEKETIYFIKIYGLEMKKEHVEYGKFCFVRKDKIIEYIKSNNCLPTFDYSDTFINGLKKQGEEKSHFVYLIKRCKGSDLDYLRLENDESVNNIVNVFRYIIGIKNERVYVDYIPSTPFNINSYVMNHDSMSSNSSIHFKDIPAFIDCDYIYSKENGNYNLWQLISSDENNELQRRIIEAVTWVGKSLLESDVNLTIAEIAFAFETMLHHDDETYISKSITASLSEAYAFINGNSYNERIEKANEFKDFYKRRSTIAHGTRLTKNNDNSCNKYYKMIYQTVKNLLTNDDYMSCKDSREFYKIIEKKRYS